jgi:hypothetical protein
MGMTGEQRRMNQVASALGYPVSQETIAVNELEIGSHIIVLTKKGEPIVTGQVEEVRGSDDMSEGSIRLGDMWYYPSTYLFRWA